MLRFLYASLLLLLLFDKAFAASFDQIRINNGCASALNRNISSSFRLLKTVEDEVEAGIKRKIDLYETTLEIQGELPKTVIVLTEIRNTRVSILEFWNVDPSKMKTLTSEHRSDFVLEYALGYDGGLHLSLRTLDIFEGQRAVILNAKLETQKIFQLWKASIKYIRGNWSVGTNMNEFNSNMQMGLDAQNAALNTWTGRTASELGFSKVTEVTTVGPIGNYLKVIALFYPQKSRKKFRLVTQDPHRAFIWQ